jgi:hypothetical protein
MEATESLKDPYLITRDTSPSRVVLEVFRFSPSDGCPATAPCLPSTQAKQSRRVSSASKTPNCVVAHRSDRCSSPVETPQTRCSLCQSPLMTQLPRSPGSTLVLRLDQETVHDFILLFMPLCGPHLTPLATGSLERSLLVFSTAGGLTCDDLSRLFFTCTNTSQAATCACNT